MQCNFFIFQYRTSETETELGLYYWDSFYVDPSGHDFDMWSVFNEGTLQAFLKLGNDFFWLDNRNQLTVLRDTHDSNKQPLEQYIHVNNEKFCNGTKKLSFYLPHVGQAKKEYFGSLSQYRKMRSEASNETVEKMIISLNNVKSGSTCLGSIALLLVFVVTGCIVT